MGGSRPRQHEIRYLRGSAVWRAAGDNTIRLGSGMFQYCYIYKSLSHIIGLILLPFHGKRAIAGSDVELRVSCRVTDPKTGREARNGAPSSDGNLGENQHLQVLQVVSHG